MIISRQTKTENYIKSRLPVLYVPFKRDWQGSGKFISEDGCGHVGTVTGVTWPGIFDGLDDYIDFGTPPALSGITEALEVEAWIKPTTIAAGERSICDHYSAVAGEGGFYLRQNAATVTFSIYIHSGGSVESATGNVLTVGTWTHVRATFNRIDQRIYINDALANTPDAQTVAIPTRNTKKCVIGVRSHDYASNWFSGTVRDVIVSNQIRGGHYRVTKWRY